MRHYGIIGFPLEHSLSAHFFNEKFAAEGIDAEYSLYPVAASDTKQIETLISELDGLNVTYPYKRAVIPYLDQLDPIAQEIGAVNVIYKHTGYNTDYCGFMESIKPLLRDFDQKALVLGTGGASKAVCHGLQQLGISPTLVSRKSGKGVLSYEQLDDEVMAAHTILINCTPLGMYPDVNSCPPIPYDKLTSRHLLYDCIYNPEETLFLQKGKSQGATIRNGIEMLIGQAREAWKIWNEDKTDK